MILFKRIITCRCDYAIIHFFQQLIQSLDRIFSDLVNQSFGRDYPGEIQLFTFLDFVFNEDLHDKRFAHRGRRRITECTIIQLIINVFLRNKEALVPFRRDGQIITYECCVGFLLKRSFSIAGFICCSGNLCATEVADARKNRTGIICNILIVRLQFKKKRDDNGMYGFRQNKGVVTIVEDEADLVRRIYKDFIDGYSYGEIADRLIADEVPTRMPGASWAKTTVQHIIRNEKYCGDCLFQKAFIANPITHQQVRNNGELPKYLVEDCLPAIVDKETWKLAQAVAARHTPHRQAPNERYPFTGKLFCGICGKPYCYYHYTTTNKQLLAAYRCMSRKTQSAAEVPGQTYTPPHKATFNRNASAKLIAYRERYCKPPKERPMLCTDVRIPTDLPQKAFCRAWNLIVAKKLRYQATLRSTVDNAEDVLVRYRAAEMCLLIDEIGKINEFSYPLMLKTLDRVVVNANGKLTFIFQSGIKITV